MTMLIAIDNDFQACLMAPTEILAEQHFTTIVSFLKGLDVQVELLTGTVKGKKRQDILTRLEKGEVQILVGTHAVIEDSVQFARLGVAVVDEQHRFGVNVGKKRTTASCFGDDCNAYSTHFGDDYIRRSRR